MMRKNFGARTWLYPMPVLIVGTQTYFGYKFREVTGHTPLKYRKRMLGKR